jgi:hypothetical protein
MSDIATKAATEFCRKHETDTDAQIAASPEMYLEHTVPYLTVRTLHRLEETLNRHEKALKGLEADSRWIKLSAIVTVFLTVILLFLTIALVILTIVLAR